MPNKHFKPPVPIDIRRDGTILHVSSVQDAAQLLMDVRWPMRGPMHEIAVDACLKVLDGHRSTEDGRVGFRDAAMEAGILVEEPHN